MAKLQHKSLHEWSDEDWDFYEDYTDRKWDEDDDFMGDFDFLN